jgi:hypothetical protein
MFSNNPNMFIWFANGRYIQDQHGQMLLEEKPALSFEYDFIKYYWNEKVFTLPGSLQEFDLSSDQIQEIEAFIQTKRTETGILGLCVDVNGNYLGRKRIDEADVHGTVDMAPPTGDDWIWDYKEKCWKRQYFYTAENVYTRKSDPLAVGFTFEAKPEHEYFKYQLDQQSKTWIKITTPETLGMYRKEISKKLTSLYVSIVVESGADANNVLSTLKTFDTANDPKLQIIEAALMETLQSPTINDIEAIYEITSMINVTNDINTADT